MMVENIILWILTGIFVVLGVLMLVGKGDWAISGYNTASAEERAQYNIRRLRLIMGVTCLAMAVVMVLISLVENKMPILILSIIFIFPAIILSNTWAKN